jgi:SulP family sulfate permease
MEKAGFVDELGRENVCPHVDAALDRAREILGLPRTPPSENLEARNRELEAAREEIASAPNTRIRF